MAINENCVLEVQKATGISEDNAREIVSIVEQKQKELRAQKNIANADSELVDFALNFATEQKIQAAVKRKQAAINIIRSQALDYRINRFLGDTKENYREAFLSILAGSHKKGYASRNSINSGRQGIESEWFGGIAARVNKERPHIVKMLRTKGTQLLDDIVREMFELKESGLPGITKNEDAIFMAKMFSEYAELARTRLNKNGAFIRKIDGWSAPQTHSVSKMSKAGKDEWVDFTLNRLDLKKTFGVASANDNVKSIMGEVWEDLVQGKSTDITSAQKGLFVGTKNLTTKHQEHRALHFKDADSWLEYSKAFSNGNVFTGMMNHLGQAARDLSIMEVLGTNPEAMLTSILEKKRIQIRETSTGKAGRKKLAKINTNLKQRTGLIGSVFAETLGETRMYHNLTAAKISAGIRAAQSITKLGMAVVSSMNDLMAYAASARYSRGMNLFEAYSEAFHSAFRGKTPEAQKQIAYSLGVSLDGIIQDIANRFNAQDTLSGKTAEAVDFYFRWTGLTGWSNRLKAGAVRGLSSDLARVSGNSFDNLPSNFRALLNMHGIDSIDWDKMRKGVITAEDGRDYLVADKVDSSVKTKLLGMYADEADHYVITPDDRTRGGMLRGTRPGTWTGEAFRFIMQFKSFPWAYGQKMIMGGRFGTIDKGMDSVGIANAIAGSLILGYAAMSAKDILKNRTPKDPRKKETWFAAAVQSGGAGLYGDFFLSQQNRFGGGPMDTLAGPTFGAASEVVKMASGSLRGEVRGADAFRFVTSNVLPLNVWYSKAALDYMVINQIEEWMSPGIMRRRERRMKEQFGQSYIFPPSP